MEISKSVNMESKLGAPWPAPPPRTAFPQGPCSPLQGTEVPQVHSQVPDPPQCTMNSHRDRDRKNTCTRTQVSFTDNAAAGVSGEKQDGEGPAKGNTQWSQLCPALSPGLQRFGITSPLPQTLLWLWTYQPQCQRGHSADRGSQALCSSWCSCATAEPSEGTGAPPGAPQEPPPVNPLLN